MNANDRIALNIGHLIIQVENQADQIAALKQDMATKEQAENDKGDGQSGLEAECQDHNRVNLYQHKRLNRWD